MNIQKNEKGIISIVTILTIGLFSLGMVTLGLMGSLKELEKNINNKNGERAFYTAEAAAREGVYQYIKTYQDAIPYAGGTPELINQVSAGSISVDDDPLNWPYVYITSNATNRNSRAVIIELNEFLEGNAFNYAIYSENDIDLGGNATVNDGNIFANGDVDISGSASINDGEIILGESIPAPQIDLDFYKNIAIDAGTFFDLAGDAENYLKNNIITAVIYIEDKNNDITKIQGNDTNLAGSLVVDGDLKITGGTFSSTDNYLAVIVDGDLEVSGGVIINGIVYVSGSTTFGAGNNKINGSLISVGGSSITDISGNSVINFIPTAVSVWEDIVGLVKTSAAPPTISSWREE